MRSALETAKALGKSILPILANGVTIVQTKRQTQMVVKVGCKELKRRHRYCENLKAISDNIKFLKCLPTGQRIERLCLVP